MDYFIKKKPRGVFVSTRPADFISFYFAIFCFSIRFISGSIRASMVIKQRLPPITFDTGSARKTPSVPMWSAYGIR